MNTGTSPYHAIHGLFCRGSREELLSVEGRNADQITKHWSTLRAQMRLNITNSTVLPSGVRVETTPIDVSGVECFPSCSTGFEGYNYAIRELLHETKGCYVGLLSCRSFRQTDQEGAFQDWMETLFLCETTLWPYPHEDDLQYSGALRMSEGITVIFESTLRNISLNDEWDVGRGEFLRRVLCFVARNERIQMACPAFPCKSPNIRKVGGRGPDMAERIALMTLHRFAQSVQEIYSPGVTVWVINDGHVFSDCIGVDDQGVSDYDLELKKAYQSMYDSDEDRRTIRFRGLTEMLFSNPDLAATMPETYIESVAIGHPINSNCSPDVETARKIMMAGCQGSREHFQRLIAEQHPPTLNLYRGQARFMQDDLATPDFLAKSTKQKKKISFVVAAEMIARNQAYSNLLEVLFPNYVRLSIHAHTNRGPKFGIRLFPRDKVRAIDSVKNRHELVPAYEFQVPTPWHNSVIKVVGDTTLYIGKAEIVRDAIGQGDYEGGWIEGPEGGHFCLTPVRSSPWSSMAQIVAEEKDPADMNVEAMGVAETLSIQEGAKVHSSCTAVSFSTTTLAMDKKNPGKVTAEVVEVAVNDHVEQVPKNARSNFKLCWTFLRSFLVSSLEFLTRGKRPRRCESSPV